MLPYCGGGAEEDDENGGGFPPAGLRALLDHSTVIVPPRNRMPSQARRASSASLESSNSTKPYPPGLTSHLTMRPYLMNTSSSSLGRVSLGIRPMKSAMCLFLSLSTKIIGREGAKVDLLLESPTDDRIWGKSG